MKICRLTRKECAILILLQQCKAPIPAAEIYERVWGEPYLCTDSNVVAVHIARLRKKGYPIKTLWGRGYLLTEK
ncbi:MAG: winged helix-turn-helix transcriptional regulator [Clostridia bacterium]|nr:winged helix-turn-helix transcriptional regulator [Clostridia bacterium]